MGSVTIDELAVGMAAELARTYGEWDLYTFAAVTGDLNPAHVDDAFAQESVFQGKIAHGMLTAGLISAVIGTRLPGPGTIYLSQELRFLRPVRVDDTVTARVEVVELVPDRNRVRLRTSCSNQSGEPVLVGTAVVMPPRVRAALTGTDAVVERAATLPVRPVAEPPRNPATAASLVGDRMRRDPIRVAPDATLAEASELMVRHRIRHLPVVESAGLVGIVTDRDVRQASLPGAPGRAAPETTVLLGLIRVREVMTPAPVTIAPEATLGEAAQLCLAHRIRGLPVVAAGRLVGIITDTDLLEALAQIVSMETNVRTGGP